MLKYTHVGHLYGEIRDYSVGSTKLPKWVESLKEKTLYGHNGKVENSDNVVYFDAGNSVSSGFSSGMRSWIEFDQNNIPVNSDVVQDAYDFFWTKSGTPNWDAKATYNPNMPNDLPLKLYIRSIGETMAQELADKKFLPADWKKYLKG